MKILVSSIIVICLFCVSSVSAELVEYLTFDSDGTATVGSNAVFVGGAAVTTGGQGISGEALSTVVEGDYARIAGYKAIGGANPRTISLWVKTAVNNTGGTFFIGWGDIGGGSRVRYDLGLQNGSTNQMRLELNSGYALSATGTTITDDAWHHLAVTWDGTTMTFYLDGAAYGTATPGTVNTILTEDVVIGTGIRQAYSTTTGRWTTGLIDEVQIYDTPLDPSDIAFLYSNPGSGIGLVPRASLVGPADGADPVSVSPTLEWVAPDDGTNIDSYDVYLGTDADVVNNPKVVDAQLVTSHSPATLAYGTTYYWRVDINDGASVYDGKTWSFTTTGKAFGSDPGDSDISVEPTGNVTWSVDPLVASCDVYFGTGSNLTYVGNYTDNYVSKADLAQAISLSMLESAQSYNWRVDTLDSGDALLVEGDVWSFTVKVYTQSYGIIIEDFDSYADNAELFVNWADGTSNGSGSVAQIEPLTNILVINYDNTALPYESGVGRSYSTPQNWMENDSAAIEINYRAAEGNDPGQMYLLLDDGAASLKVINPVADAAGEIEWRSWRVSLGEFAEAGVDCGNIVYFEIGFGDAAAGGAGVMYLNDIVLKRSACLDEYMSAADLDGDCDVDSSDLILLAAQWLRADYPVTAQQPSAASLRVHYAFEEMAGFNAVDSSGNGFDAQIVADSLVGVWGNSGVYGGNCIDIADANVVIPVEVFSAVDDGFTMAFWIDGEPADWPTNADTIEFSAGAKPIISNDWDRLYWQIDSADSYGGQWNHYAFVKDTTAAALKIYHNGVLAAQNLDAFADFSGNSGESYLETLGQTGQFKVDELYVYDTALSQSEIVYLLSGAGSQVIQPISPVLSNADIMPDGSVNMADLAVFAQNWLASQVWP